jgi:hypothetical protein
MGNPLPQLQEAVRQQHLQLQAAAGHLQQQAAAGQSSRAEQLPAAANVPTAPLASLSPPDAAPATSAHRGFSGSSLPQQGAPPTLLPQDSCQRAAQVPAAQALLGGGSLHSSSAAGQLLGGYLGAGTGQQGAGTMGAAAGATQSASFLSAAPQLAPPPPAVSPPAAERAPGPPPAPPGWAAPWPQEAEDSGDLANIFLAGVWRGAVDPAAMALLWEAALLLEGGLP